MLITIVRHAIAAPHGSVEDDTKRPLTKEGIEKLRGVVQGMAKLEMRFDHVYESPWLRAKQTADYLEDLLDGPRCITEGLTCSPSPKFLEELEGKRIAVVGHEPYLTELIALLVFGSADASDKLELKKAGVVELEGDAKPGGCRLLSWIPPRVMRSVR